MTIRDIAGNALPAGQGGQMIGYIEPTAAEEVLPLKAYQFLIEVIRTSDLNDGNLFLKRYFDGIQTVWEEEQAAIFAIKDLWSVTDIPDAFLTYLKNIVGWTKSLEYITKNLDASTLRRLIAASVPLWKTRGPEDAMLNVLRLTTGARLRIWNWFDFRFVLDETEMGTEHQGRDPWLINLPGTTSYDEYTSNLRIADDGTLNRTLVEDLVRLMRAASERIEISYIDFLDLFNTDGDSLQWDVITGAPIVSEGKMALANSAIAESVKTNRIGAGDWTNYVVGARIRAWATTDPGKSGMAVYHQDANNRYIVTLEVRTNSATISKVVGGVPTVLATRSFSDFSMTLVQGTYYMMRVHVGPDVGGTRIKFYLDNIAVMDVLDSPATFTKGAVGIFHEPTGTCDVDEVEMFQLPLDTVLIDINT